MDVIVKDLIQLYKQGVISGDRLHDSLEALQTPIPKPRRPIPQPRKRRPIPKRRKCKPIPKPRKRKPAEPTDDELLAEFKPQRPTRAPSPPPRELKWDETKAFSYQLRAWKMQVPKGHPSERDLMAFLKNAQL